jgi:hypothetical protein
MQERRGQLQRRSLPLGSVEGAAPNPDEGQRKPRGEAGALRTNEGI